jgi:uncharacterized DUF497 family protein
MRIEFDPAKDEANVAKHGVSLALARALDWTLRSYGWMIDSATTNSA